MSRPDDEPIIARPSPPIIVKPTEVPIAGPPIWLRQELGQRGKNTCYPTSIINASVAVGAIRPEEAGTAYESIMQDLLKVPNLWHEYNLNISNATPYLIDLFEYHLPIRVGYQQGGMKLITIPHSFTQIFEELDNPIRHTIVNRNAAHAYATVNKTQRSIVYIDATDPTNYRQTTQENFGTVFGIDSLGYVITTPIQPR
jgi:hypothetical protein